MAKAPTAPAERGTVSFTFGGVARRCRVPLSLVVDIEETAGIGAIDLVRQQFSKSAKVATSLEVLRLVLEANGVTYTRDQMIELFQREGIVETHNSAAKVLNALFVKRGASAGGNDEPPNSTADATP
jgi:hypothetical protein